MDLNKIGELTKNFFKAQDDLLNSIPDKDEKQRIKDLCADMNKSLENFENEDPNELMQRLIKKASVKAN